ncbi:transient receptor potential cation channel subfamily A member 1-like [Actinia tenebrosa]|uniref:Transient receptor potential cation channel subfamily A member 1-like n=1 Tax=Actinia tenebrosa TaxID=6105 RepID=A0A6P8J5B5_ACTTE|nr:transient receptor potential cation channel subfamily A member 1-like [Actinia tenebrosa]
MICKILVNLGAEITEKSEDNMTPLAIAVAKGASDVAQYLFEEVQAKKLDTAPLFYNVGSDGSTLLHLAADSGILPIVDLCLRSGCHIDDTKESDGTTAFHVACAQGSIEIVQLLVNHSKDICKADLQDAHNMTPLHHAAACGNMPIVTFLIDQGAQVDPRDNKCRTPLFLASTSGFNDTVQVLLDRGADVSLKDTERRSAFHAAVGHAGVMETLCKSPLSKTLIVDKDVTGYSPVHYAARAGHLKNITLFLSKNKAAKTVTSDSLDTPLHIGAKYGWLAIVQMLLKKRNARLINAQNKQGRTALHLAAGEGQEDITELLLVEGATIERDRSERTPLHLAALNGSETCIDYILQSHPDCLNTVDKNQNTAINLAAMSGHVQIVSRLLSVPEQQILLNKFNQTVLDLAINADKHEVAMKIAEHERWKDVMLVSPGGGLAQLQTLVKRMPDVAEKILDQCVTSEGDPNSKDYKITYDLGLIQGKNSSDQKLTDTMIALRTMAERRRENCLTHPVCFFLMKLKWKKFGWLTFTINISLYLAFLLCFTTLVVYLRSNDKEFCGFQINQTRICGSPVIVKGDPNAYLAEYTTVQLYTVRMLHTLVIVLAVFHLSKEILQIYRLRFKYLLDLTNYIEWGIYAGALVYVIPYKMCKYHDVPQAAAFSLFLGWLNLILYFRRMSFYGKYVIMLTTMFKTLLQVMVLFALFLMAFGTTFFVLMDNKLAYSTLWYSIMKTFSMTLGELNYEDTFIPSSKLHYAPAMNILFLLFCLGMPIILMNMLIGLAVGDIDKIQQKSVMDRYVMQVELLIEVEESLPSFILRRVQVSEHVAYPNRKSPLKARVLDTIQGFGEPEKTEDEDSNLPPALAQIVDRIEDHENKIDEMYAMMKEHTTLLRAIVRREGIDTESGGTLKKGIVGWFKRH